ncbi:MAG: hypothetical protein Q9202_005116 [Teloschistes flavicans]
MEGQDEYDAIVREVQDHLGVASEDHENEIALDEANLDVTDTAAIRAARARWGFASTRYVRGGMRGGHSQPMRDDHLRPAPLSMADLSMTDFLRDSEPPSAPGQTPAPAAGKKMESTPAGRKVSFTNVKNWFTPRQGPTEAERTFELHERSRRGRALIPDAGGMPEMPYAFSEGADASAKKGSKGKISFPSLRKMSEGATMKSPSALKSKDSTSFPSPHKASSSFPSPMPPSSSPEESSAAANPITPYSMTKHHVGLLEDLPLVSKDEVAKLPKFLAPNVPLEESHLWHAGGRPRQPLYDAGHIADNTQGSAPVSHHHEPSGLKISKQRKPQQYKGDYTNTGTMHSSPPFKTDPVAHGAKSHVPFLHDDQTSNLKNKREMLKLDQSYQLKRKPVPMVSSPQTDFSGGNAQSAVPNISPTRTNPNVGYGQGYALPSDRDPLEPKDYTSESPEQYEDYDPMVGIKKYRSMSSLNTKYVDDNSLESFPPLERAPKEPQHSQPDRIKRHQDIDPTFGTSGYPSQRSANMGLVAGNAGIAQRKPSLGELSSPTPKFNKRGKVKKYKKNDPMLSNLEFAAFESIRGEDAAKERYVPPAMYPSATPAAQQQPALRPSKQPTNHGIMAHAFTESTRSQDPARGHYAYPAMTPPTDPTAQEQPAPPPANQPTDHGIAADAFMESTSNEDAARRRYVSSTIAPLATTTAQHQLPTLPTREPTNHGITAHTFLESTRAVKQRRDRVHSHDTIGSLPIVAANTPRSGTLTPRAPTYQISEFYSGLQQNSSRMLDAPAPSRGRSGSSTHGRSIAGMESSPSFARAAAAEAGVNASPAASDIIDEYTHRTSSRSSSQDSKQDGTSPQPSYTRRLSR